jgi:glyoxylase-like metal-dependent hydrolase (beta-lactamase superfamily II)
MTAFICTLCGTQFTPSDAPPDGCPICQEERQYVNPHGQSWTTLEQLRGSGKPWLASQRNGYTKYEPELYGIITSPGIGIGQRALLLRTPHGNVLWDCITYIDDATVDVIGKLGGISAIAISHPHYYTTMVDWSRAFGGVPILLHEDDREWVMQPDPVIEFWKGATREIFPGVTLIHTAGHFAGAAVLHWAAGAGGKGALLTGDTLQVVGPDKTISFMWSFPNLIPLDANTVRRVADAVEPWPFESVYGAWPEALIKTGGKQILAHSVDRYIEAVTQPPPRRRGEAATRPPAGQRGELESAAAQSGVPAYRWRHSG